MEGEEALLKPAQKTDQQASAPVQHGYPSTATALPRRRLGDSIRRPCAGPLSRVRPERVSSGGPRKCTTARAPSAERPGASGGSSTRSTSSEPLCSSGRSHRSCRARCSHAARGATCTPDAQSQWRPLLQACSSLIFCLEVNLIPLCAVHLILYREHSARSSARPLIKHAKNENCQYHRAEHICG